MGLLMFAVYRSVVLLGSAGANPLISGIPILAGISFFYVFDNFNKLLSLTDGIAESEVSTLVKSCSGRCVSSFVLALLVTSMPGLIR